MGNLGLEAQRSLAFEGVFYNKKISLYASIY